MYTPGGTVLVTVVVIMIQRDEALVGVCSFGGSGAKVDDGP